MSGTVTDHPIYAAAGTKKSGRSLDQWNTTRDEAQLSLDRGYRRTNHEGLADGCHDLNDSPHAEANAHSFTGHAYLEVCCCRKTVVHTDRGKQVRIPSSCNVLLDTSESFSRLRIVSVGDSSGCSRYHVGSFSMPNTQGWRGGSAEGLLHLPKTYSSLAIRPAPRVSYKNKIFPPHSLKN